MRACLGLIALLVVAGCGTRVDETAAGVGYGKDGARDSSVVTPTLDAKWRGTMTVTPATAAPGQRVALRFQSKEVRGIAFSLSAWSNQGWTVAYYLTSDWGSPGSHTPDWWAVEDSEGRGWPDVRIGGPGPDHVIVPDTAPAGDYLLCTANSVHEACAILTVTG
jgi:hypothetical protein